MFSRTFKSTVIVSVVAFLGITRGVPTSDNTSQCDTGNMQCCNQTLNPTTNAALGGLLGMFGLGEISGSVGLDCTPINVLGIGSSGGCAAQPVCCTDVTQTGLINFGCSPLNLNL